MKINPGALILYISLAGLAFSLPKKSTKKNTSVEFQIKPITLEVNTLLWQITGKGLKEPSYLFGTMHILCSEDAQLSTTLKNIIRDCSQVYLEVDMDNMQELFGAVKYLRMNDGRKLSELITTEEFERVKAYFEKNKSPLPFSMMNRLKPYFITSLIGEQMMSCEKTNGMEQLIIKETKKYDKEIKGLETTKFQASIFDSIPYEKQAKDLVEYIDSIGKYKKVTHQMMDAYRKQDLKLIEELTLSSEAGIEDYLDLLLYDRNRRWSEQMPIIMEERSTLFAVGAGHLPGELGVIKLLQNQGFIVKPIKN